MSTEEKVDNDKMELEQQSSPEPIDELEEEYDEIEEHSSDLPYLITGYRHILLNNREDETANKIKEKAIYG
jgi:hypothetical protein